MVMPALVSAAHSHSARPIQLSTSYYKRLLCLMRGGLVTLGLSGPLPLCKWALVSPRAMATRAHTASVPVLSSVPRLTSALARTLPGLDFPTIRTDDVKSVARLKESEIIIADLNLLGPFMNQLKNVKWVQSTWAGAEVLFKYVNKSQPPPNYPIVRFTGLHFGRMMSEYVIAHIVSLEREFKKVSRNQEDTLWDTTGKIKDYRVISELTVGVLGLGAIGSEVAKCMKFFGATVWGLVRTIPEVKQDFVDEYRTTGGLGELVSKCDYLVSVLPDTEDTRGLLSGEVLSRAKEGGAVLINVGRGSLISERDLIEALDRGYLSAAVLDVFPEEPLPPDSPLWSNPKVTITPHSSAVSRATDIAQVFAKNYNLWESGRPFDNVFRFDRGY